MFDFGTASLQVIRRHALSNLTMPAGRFFTPLPLFWYLMSCFSRQVKFIDCGCGDGSLLIEAREHEIPIVRAVDLAHREGQLPEVEKVDATELEWSPYLWPLLCRPSHDGWAQEVMENARKQQSSTIYVGLPSNYHRDVFRHAVRMAKGPVGQDGERMYLLRPPNATGLPSYLGNDPVEKPPKRLW